MQVSFQKKDNVLLPLRWGGGDFPCCRRDVKCFFFSQKGNRTPLGGVSGHFFRVIDCPAWMSSSVPNTGFSSGFGNTRLFCSLRAALQLYARRAKNGRAMPF